MKTKTKRRPCPAVGDRVYVPGANPRLLGTVTKVGLLSYTMSDCYSRAIISVRWDNGYDGRRPESQLRIDTPAGTK